MLPILTYEGRLTADPTLRFTNAGVAVCSFTLATNDRKRNDSGEWEDTGDPLFIRITAWRNLAENVAESLLKGDLAIVIGKLSNRKYTDKEGNERQSLEIEARTVATSLQFRSFKHQGKSRGASGSDDPWSDVPPPQDSDEPPF